MSLGEGVLATLSILSLISLGFWVIEIIKLIGEDE